MAVEAKEAKTTSAAVADRRLPIGAEPRDGGAHFRLWAPRRGKKVEVVLESGGGATPLTSESNGYFSGIVPAAKPGALYRLRLDAGENLFPDPASRFQPHGPHGPSQIIDPASFPWTDQNWTGISAAGQVVYEMHIGTFTKEGTWASATAELPCLADLGITCLEVMPVGEFAGRWGWGYDGVDLFAPFHHYGTPDDFRRFVDTAHKLGVAVILDLVYNHLGPDGNYLREFSEHYFNAHHMTDWGKALNFDGDQSAGPREFFVANAVYWITEYHLDGFRFDATQAIVDSSDEHILAVISREARKAATHRSIYLINENEPQHTRLVRPTGQRGYGLDALWNDDFHHTAMVALTGHDEAYYTDYNGSAQELLSAAKWGYLYQGQRYKWQKKRRGTWALDLPPTAFVHFLQNHDQIANSGRGQRIHELASPGALRAMTALLLLMPQTPMLFQGQEFAASNRFYYFANHNAELNKLIKAGRAKELSQFPSLATAEMQPWLIDPGAEETFTKCKLDSAEREKPFHSEIYQLHKDLLKLRRSEAVFRRVQQRGDIDGAVLSPQALVIRYFDSPPHPFEGGDPPGSRDRLLLINLGPDMPMDPAPEPLLAPPADHRWTIVFSSEDPQYGGNGTPPVETEREGWLLMGRCAMLLQAAPADRSTVQTRFVTAGSAQEAKLRPKP